MIRAASLVKWRCALLASSYNRSMVCNTRRSFASGASAHGDELHSLSSMKHRQHLMSSEHKTPVCQSAVAADDNVDLRRALCFMQQGSIMDARQALMESLRLHPFCVKTRRLLLEVDQSLAPIFELPKSIAESEPIFALLYSALKHHTMLTWPRLLSLFMQAKALAHPSSPRGDIVECGCAGGGSVVLMAAALKYFSDVYTVGNSSQHQTQQLHHRRIFAYDTFSGMPPPTARDALLQGKPANETHWGTGTCSGSEHHVHALARAFGVDILTIPGLFQNTLVTSSNIDRENQADAPSPSSCALLHCDADWYESTVCVLQHFLPRMNQGSTIQIDDYHYWNGCKMAVDEVLGGSTAMELGIRAADLREIDGNAVFLVVPSL